ncbi:MAG: hypothetical protein U0637_12170 [Phycisphaerales bacterium]
MKLAVAVCALIAGAAVAPAQAQNMLTNPGFESGLSGWTPFGNVFAESVTPRTGSGVAKMFGNWSGGFNVSGFFQTFPAAPGQNWSFEGYLRHNTGDNMVGTGIPNGGSGNWVIAKMEFRDASDTAVGFVESAPVDGTSPTDVWLQRSVSLTAPANTVSVWAFFLYLQPQFDGGAILVDDARLIPAPGFGAVAGGALVAFARRRRR